MNLIFITSEFPYGTGESFIENEIEYFESRFERIFIIPVDLQISNISGVRKLKSKCMVQVIPKIHCVGVFPLLSILFFKRWRAENRYTKDQLKIPFGFSKLRIASASYLKAKRIELHIRKLISEFSLDQVVIYSYWMNEGLLAGIFCQQTNQKIIRKVISRAHGWDVYFERHQPPYLPWRKFLFDNSDGIYCVSKDGQNYLSAKFPGNSVSKIKLAYLGVPCTPETSLKPVFSLSGLRILSCSSAIKLKRVELILEAISKTDIRNVHWTHIGDGPLLKDIQQKADHLMAMKPDVKITLTGYLQPDLRNKFMGSGSFHLFVNVSEYEGLPVSIMEAMSFGIPVVATAVGGTQEIVLDGYNGFILKMTPTVAEIVRVFEDFYNLPFGEKLRIQNNAFKTWYESFNSDNNYRAFWDNILDFE